LDLDVKRDGVRIVRERKYIQGISGRGKGEYGTSNGTMEAKED
jgi:hypothetical protein